MIELVEPVRLSIEPDWTVMFPALADPMAITSAPVAPVPIFTWSRPVPVAMLTVLPPVPEPMLMPEYEPLPLPILRAVVADPPMFSVVTVELNRLAVVVVEVMSALVGPLTARFPPRVVR